MAPPSITALQSVVDKMVMDPRIHDLLTVVKGARNGAVYGAKIRFPHALVMILLYRSGTLREKLRLVFRATRAHARNLAYFCTIYKLTMLFLQYTRPMLSSSGPRTGGPIRPMPSSSHAIALKPNEGRYDAFLAGLLGGYFVFSRRSPRTGRVPAITQQIVIYIFARVVLAMARLAIKPRASSEFAWPVVSANPKLARKVEAMAWPAFASLSWAMVMYLFRWYPDELQSSLRNSMSYIYEQSDQWDSVRTLLWHNK